MKKLILILSFAFLGLTAQAQIQYIEEKPQYIEKQADSLTKIYTKKLGLTPKQDLLFKSNVADYLIKREEIKKNYKGKKMLDQLYIVSKEESGSMSEVLTEYQFELYEKIKPSIQPLAKVDQD
ncbi:MULTISPECIES: hypothetical protein [Leeuwenhoekiella]|jgi:hypothetical protein|uniref:hypothetical protein n=1 Tax=Leeuwenhoekiella TaxID=283735 RepID=UPI000C39BFAD|nr:MULTISPECIES: hypothetical protein [Leeuwenhoekiella]MAO45083.1 hypothetical protein [Leeuwenhoekiella sp.]HBT08174.1 hypothetical protein [Leeuwenhoekiella sp.]HCW63137.1 hypothetical protein [Leeuwenhoekiella sp.]|tara:strand:- start:2630 stop:2998 length:369 start_codon:yes stop_codon:yes gene_type:complete